MTHGSSRVYPQSERGLVRADVASQHYPPYGDQHHDGYHGPANYAVGRPVGHFDQVVAQTSPAESPGFERQRPGLDGDQGSREEWNHHGQKCLETAPEVRLEVESAGLLGLYYGAGPPLHLRDELERGHEHVGQFRGQPLVYKSDHHRLGIGREHHDQDRADDHKHPEEDQQTVRHPLLPEGHGSHREERGLVAGVEKALDDHDRYQERPGQNGSEFRHTTWEPGHGRDTKQRDDDERRPPGVWQQEDYYSEPHGYRQLGNRIEEGNGAVSGPVVEHLLGWPTSHYSVCWAFCGR